MIASRRLFSIRSFAVLALLTVALSGCRSSMVAEGPPASPPPPPPPTAQTIDVQPDASIPPAKNIVDVSQLWDTVTWKLVGGTPDDRLDIQVQDPHKSDPFKKDPCKNDECTVKLKKVKKLGDPPEPFKYEIIVHHMGAPDSVNDPVIIWR